MTANQRHLATYFPADVVLALLPGEPGWKRVLQDLSMLGIGSMFRPNDLVPLKDGLMRIVNRPPRPEIPDGHVGIIDPERLALARVIPQTEFDDTYQRFDRMSAFHFSITGHGTKLLADKSGFTLEDGSPLEGNPEDFMRGKIRDADDIAVIADLPLSVQLAILYEETFTIGAAPHAQTAHLLAMLPRAMSLFAGSTEAAQADTLLLDTFGRDGTGSWDDLLDDNPPSLAFVLANGRVRKTLAAAGTAQ